MKKNFDDKRVLTITGKVNARYFFDRFYGSGGVLNE